MKEINLREFYPEIYKTDLFISLPDEVVDVLVEYQRKEVAYRRRTYRHNVTMNVQSHGAGQYVLHQIPP